MACLADGRIDGRDYRLDDVECASLARGAHESLTLKIMCLLSVDSICTGFGIF